jgi:hypothetical protein
MRPGALQTGLSDRDDRDGLEFSLSESATRITDQPLSGDTRSVRSIEDVSRNPRAEDGLPNVLQGSIVDSADPDIVHVRERGSGTCK